MTSCRSCLAILPHAARFCPSCGAAVDLAERTAVRKLATIVFSDVVGSTALAEQMDPEKWGRIMTTYFSEVDAILRRHGGLVEKYVGDAVLAVFGLPVVREDDALRACRAALEMRDAVSSLNERLASTLGIHLQTRTGVNTGEVVATAPTRDEMLPLGDPANVAARLQSAAAPGEIYIGDATHRLVRPVVVAEQAPSLALRGKAETVAAWRLVGIAPLTASAPPTRFDSPLVGRDSELSALEAVVDGAIRDRACRLATVVGDPGIGKSRLAAELVGRLRGASVLRARCLSYGEGITFWPLAEVIKQAAGIDEDLVVREATDALRRLLASRKDGERVAQSLAAAIGWSDASIPIEEIFWAARATLEHLARRRPVVVVIDDIHWAEQRLLDLIEHVGRSSARVPIVVLCLARPDLLQARPSWETAVPGHSVLRLQPLSDDGSGVLASSLLGTTDLSLDVRRSLTSAAEGNPLFIEQLIASWSDRGILERAGTGWRLVSDPRSLSVPSGIRPLLQSRIDRLPAWDRNVLEHAAVIGQVFQIRALADLMSDEARRVDSGLEALEKARIIERHSETSTPEPSYRFRHVLLRDATYEGALKSRRAEIHERFGWWLAASIGDRLTEYEELLGYHFEQAYHYVCEVGSVDERALGLAREASEHLASAGRRAFARSDATAAANLLSRAAALLPEDNSDRLALLPELGEALNDAGRPDEADGVLRAAIEGASNAGDDLMRARAIIPWAWLRQYTAGWGEVEMEHQAREVLPVLEAAGDHRSVAGALHLLTKSAISHGRFDDLESLIDQIITHASWGADLRREAVMRAWRCTISVWGPTPVRDGIERCHRALRWTERTPGTDFAVGVVNRALGVLEAMTGNFHDARMHVEKSSSIFEALGLVGSWIATQDAAAEVELLAQCPDAAEAVLRAALDPAESQGAYRHGIAVRLAEAALARGRVEEADDLTIRSADYRRHPDADNAASWGAIRARTLARLGRAEEALEIAREAAARVSDGGYLEARSATHVAVGEALLVSRDPAGARIEFKAALQLYRRKGDLVRPRLLPEPWDVGPIQVV